MKQKKNFPAISLILSSLLCLSAFDCSSSRQCTEFNHPEITDWSAEKDGDIVRFSDGDGESISFTVGKVSRSEPYVETAFGSTPEAVCKLSALRNYKSNSDFPSLQFKFFHGEWSRKELDEELFLLDIILESVNSVTLPQKFYFYLQNNSESDRNDGVYEHTYFPELKLEEITFTHVISSSLVNTDIVEKLETAEHKIVRMLIAREVGLIRLERADGQVFNREI